LHVSINGQPQAPLLVFAPGVVPGPGGASVLDAAWGVACGRDEGQCRVLLADKSVSRTHARLRFTQPTAANRSNSSSNNSCFSSSDGVDGGVSSGGHNGCSLVQCWVKDIGSSNGCFIRHGDAKLRVPRPLANGSCHSESSKSDVRSSSSSSSSSSAAANSGTTFPCSARQTTLQPPRGIAARLPSPLAVATAAVPDEEPLTNSQQSNSPAMEDDAAAPQTAAAHPGSALPATAEARATGDSVAGAGAAATAIAAASGAGEAGEVELPPGSVLHLGAAFIVWAPHGWAATPGPADVDGVGSSNRAMAHLHGMEPPTKRARATTAPPQYDVFLSHRQVRRATGGKAERGPSSAFRASLSIKKRS
jgi:hypothetical protein